MQEENWCVSFIGHKDVEIKWYGSRSYIDKKYADVYRNMFDTGRRCLSR